MEVPIGIPFLIKRFLIFLAIYISLALLFNFTSLKQYHHSAFTKVITPLHNSLNPRIYAEFKKETRTDRRHFGISIGLYDKNKHGINWDRPGYRRNLTADITKFPNLHAIVTLPIIMLVTLILVTPISWKRKMVNLIFGIGLYYLILTFYFGYIFEMTINRGPFEISSVWQFVISVFGVDNSEILNVFAFLLWLAISTPPLVRRYRQGSLTIN